MINNSIWVVGDFHAAIYIIIVEYSATYIFSALMRLGRQDAERAKQQKNVNF